MYLPYLRGRQFELIALRELAQEKVTQEFIIPIIEPVKDSKNNLLKLNAIFSEEAQLAFLVMNPLVGELSGDSNLCLDFNNQVENSVFSPAFHYHNNSGYIQRSLDDFDSNKCLIICPNEVNPEDPQFVSLMSDPRVTSISVEDPGRNRSLNRYLRGLGKEYIRFDDLFEKQSKNSDFLNISGHLFSEEHLYFDTEGFYGFSDYTALASEFSIGGSTPRAVVIHITFLNEKNQIWIRHFTSNTNDSIANVQGKFAEAAKKAITFCHQNSITNSAIEELEQYYKEEHYPGLGTVKKISIKNHLLVINQYFNSLNS